MNLRDHDAPCEHEGSVGAQYTPDSHWWCSQVDCPGGAEVDINYEAASRAFATSPFGEIIIDLPVMTPDELVGLLVDAALGLTDG